MIKPSVTVIIPTTGAETLSQCVKSVLNQTYDNVKPYLIFDGREFADKVTDIWDLEDELDGIDISYTILQHNVGKNGWYGHRIFAAFSYLVNTDYVCFLDQDNWFEPNHVETLIGAVDPSNPNGWAYSLRNIVDSDGTFICRDDCESLGHFGKHIDTSCYLVPTKILTSGIAGAWYGQWGADRQFYDALNRYYPLYECSGKYTVNYRLGGNAGSVKKEFFLEGNKYTAIKYKNNYPWNKET